MRAPPGSAGLAQPIRHIPLSYDNTNSEASALRLVLTLFPDWEHAAGHIEFERFTDGITNTLLKAVIKRPGASEVQIDDEAVLLRAYGKGTDVLIDRERECMSHSLLSQRQLAPALLARFQNGLLYKFVRGRVCTSSDLTREPVWRGVARRLGQWHAVLPVVSAGQVPTHRDDKEMSLQMSGAWSQQNGSPSHNDLDGVLPGKPVPNVWTVMQKWIKALPTWTGAEKKRMAVLQGELELLVSELGDAPGLGVNGLVFGHCDLLSGNVIVHSGSDRPAAFDGMETVTFIDYEYATPSPAAFDIANFFAEWGGFECNYSVLPTRSQRNGFIQEYLGSYQHHLESKDLDTEREAQGLFDQVDAFRGVPGFYWQVHALLDQTTLAANAQPKRGIWALIQATISQIDFDYASYAEVRLGEYWAWRGEQSGSRARTGTERPLRERRWAQET